MRFKILLFTWILFFGASSTVYAAPMKLTHQGRLSDATTQAPLGGSHTMKFSIYDALSGGTEKWTETHTVTFVDGYYSVILGNSSALTGAIMGLHSRWLEIKVGSSTPFSPRQEITSAAYAFGPWQWCNQGYKMVGIAANGEIWCEQDATTTTAETNAIAANSAKTGISSSQTSAITANTAKVSFPGFGTTSNTALRGDSLSDYATQNWVTSTALSGYASENWVTTQEYTKVSWVADRYGCPAVEIQNSTFEAPDWLPNSPVGTSVDVVCVDAPGGGTWNCVEDENGLPEWTGDRCHAVRLKNYNTGDTTMNSEISVGLVEVYHNGEWGLASGWNFSSGWPTATPDIAAEVACIEMGWTGVNGAGDARLYSDWPYGNLEGSGVDINYIYAGSCSGGDKLKDCMGSCGWMVQIGNHESWQSWCGSGYFGANYDNVPWISCY